MNQLIRHEPEDLARLSLQIEQARCELAGLEAECSLTQRTLRSQRAAIFQHLAPTSQIRDELRLEVRFLAETLENLRVKVASEVEEAAKKFQSARDQVREEYAKASREAEAQKPPTPEDSDEANALWRKLVKLYHPDRLGMESEMRDAYHRLISAINHARDAGDLSTLKDIAADPQDFLERKGWGTLKTEQERRWEDLQKLLQSLENEIRKVRAIVDALKRSPDFELHEILRAKPEVFQQVVDKQLGQLDAEITVLNAQIRSLGTEIEKAKGSAV